MSLCFTLFTYKTVMWSQNPRTARGEESVRKRMQSPQQEARHLERPLHHGDLVGSEFLLTGVGGSWKVALFPRNPGA